MDRPWFRHYDEWVPTSVDIPDVPLDRLLRDSAEKHPDHTALIFGARVGSRVLDAAIRYRELDQMVDRFAAGLQRLGVAPGDRVAIMLPNSPQFIIAAYATWRIGGVVVCCNPLYVEREVEHLLQDSGAETMVVMSSLYDRVKAVRGNTALKRVVVANIKEHFPLLLKVLFTLTKERKEGHRVDLSGDADTHRFPDILASGAGTPSPVEVDPRGVSTLIYTGGTTGGPKGAQLTHRNLVSNATILNLWARSREAGEVLISLMPFFHSYGLTVGINTVFANALTAVLIPNPRDLEHTLLSVQKHRATFMPAIPTLFVAFSNHPDLDQYDLSTVRFAPSGAAPLAPEVQKQFESISGCKMVEAYGLTETSPTATMDPIGNPRAHSIGVPIPNTDVKIVDIEDGGAELPQGETGEIIIKGDQVMVGYWNLPEETEKAIRVGPDGEPGWFYSGDIGFQDEDGYFHIADRKKDMIIAGGYNIYPADVEAVLFEHPALVEAAVIGVPDEKRGETVKAFVVLHEGQTATEDEIIAFCRERMAAYRIPRMVEFIDELPKTVIGKVLRRELRDKELAR
jgi:long-chain acyl-CoA synthetase